MEASHAHLASLRLFKLNIPYLTHMVVYWTRNSCLAGCGALSLLSAAGARRGACSGATWH